MSSAASSPAHSVASGSTGVAANENSDQFKFSTSEKVFCYHGPLIYDARCVKSKLIDGKPTYLIHYHGWSKNWDEWVDESRILVYNDESKRLYEQSNMKKKNVTPRGAGQKRKSATAEKNTAESTPTSSGGGGGGKVAKTLSSSSSSSANVDSPSVLIHSTHKKSESGQSRSGKNLSSPSSISTSVSTPTTSSAVAGSISTLALKSSDYQSDDDDEEDNVKEDEEQEDVKDNVLAEKVSTKEPSLHHSSQTLQTPAHGTVTTIAASSATPIVKKQRKRSSKLLRNEITENRLMLAASGSIGTTIKIAIPDGLKQILVDDMDYINNKSMLVYFPQPMTINEILDEYIRERADKFREHFEKQQQEQMESTNESSDDTNQHNPLTQGNTAPFTSIQLQNDDLNLKLDNFGHRFYRSCLRDVCNGIRNYFNVLLGTQLLYKFERVQYRQQVKLLLASLSNPESSNAKQSPNNNNNNSTDPNGSSDSESKSNLEPGASMDTENSSSSTSSFVIAHHQKKSLGTGKGTSRPSGNKAKAGSNKGSNKGQNNNNNNLSGSQENSFFRACNNQSLPLCSVYGFTHLLRLFTVLGRMVSTFQLDQGIVDTLLAVFDDLLAYLDENRDRLFDPDRIYTNVDQEYFRVAL